MATSSSDLSASGRAGSARRGLRYLLLPAASVWLVAIVVGFRAMANYAMTPGLAAEAPAHVAAGTIGIDARLPTLLVFVHPFCPCTRATLAELARLTARCTGRMRTRVLFHSEAALAVDWNSNELWKLAHEIPGVEVEQDIEGHGAQALGVRTSGQALLYASDGRLLFAGGITAARGHAGDNAGEDEIADLIRDARAEPRNTPVFGCPLTASPSPSKCSPR